MTGHLRPASELGVVSVIDTVTRLYALEGEVVGDELLMLCPDPNHEDSRPSVSVNLVTGFYHCFSCGRGGDLVGLGMLTLGKDEESVKDLLMVRTPDALQAMLASLQVLHARDRTQVQMDPVPFPHEYAAGPLTELRRRGFTMETLRRWNVRYVASQQLTGAKGPFTIYASMGIPLLDTRRRVLAWCYRRTAHSPRHQPRYVYTGGAKVIRHLWFGQQFHADESHVVVVEGALDAMWCDQCGVPAVAMLGSSPSVTKIAWLTRFDRVTILADRDAAGATAVDQIGRALTPRIGPGVRVARYRGWMGATDPQELAPVDLELVVESALPWAEYEVRRRENAV